MSKKGITSREFVNVMESPGGLRDADVTGMSEEQFKKLVATSKKISNFTRAMKKRGHTEFSTAWGTKILIDANSKMAKAAGLLDMLQGGIDDSEQERINKMAKTRAKEGLRYIA